MIHGHLSYTQFSTTLTGTTDTSISGVGRRTYSSRQALYNTNPPKD